MYVDLGWTRKAWIADKIARVLNRLINELDFPGYVMSTKGYDSYGKYYGLVMECFPSHPKFDYDKLRKIIELKNKLLSELER